MSCNTFGNYIADARKMQGITQEELCFGICSPGTLSRIENGSTIPRRRIYEALMQRLGQPVSLWRLPISDVDMELYGSLRHAVQCIMHNDWEMGEALLRVCRGRERVNGNSRQFWQLMGALLQTHKGVEPDVVLEELERALSVTGRRIEDSLYHKCLLTFEELIILNNIAIQYQRKQNYSDAFYMWDQLKTYLETRKMDPDEKDRVYSMLLHNYANLLRVMGQWQESLDICETGIAECRKSSRYLLLPYLLYCKGESLKQLGRNEEAVTVSVQSDDLFHLYQQDSSCRGEAIPIIL